MMTALSRSAVGGGNDRFRTRAPWGALVISCLLLPWVSPAVLGDAAIENQLRELDARIQAYPDEQEWRIRRARAYTDAGRYDAAMEDIRAAQALGDPAEAAYVYGVLLYHRGDLEAAREQFDRYLSVYPGHRASLDYRARLLRDAGDYERALADYQRLFSLSDDLDPGYYIAAANMLAALPDRGTDEALAMLDTRMETIGPVTSLQRHAIGLEKDRGNYPAAISRLAMLDERLRATPEWQVEMAQLLLLAGRPEEALPYILVAEEQLGSLRQTGARRELAATLPGLKREAREAVTAGAAAQASP